MMSQSIKLLTLLTLILMCGCATEPNHIGYNQSVPNEDNLSTSVSIASLKERCNSRPQRVDENISISGYVISSDNNGNLMNALYISDMTSSAEILISRAPIFASFPKWSKVRVRCNSLYMQLYEGVLRIGLFESMYDIGAIPDDEIDVYLDRVDSDSHTIPQIESSIEQLDNSMLGYETTVSGIEFRDEDAGDPWLIEDATSVRYMDGSEGDSIAIITTPSASYAHYQIPSGSGSVSGMLLYRDGVYSLYIMDYTTIRVSNDKL